MEIAKKVRERVSPAAETRGTNPEETGAITVSIAILLQYTYDDGHSPPPWCSHRTHADTGQETRPYAAAAATATQPQNCSVRWQRSNRNNGHSVRVPAFRAQPFHVVVPIVHITLDIRSVVPIPIIPT